MSICRLGNVLEILFRAIAAAQRRVEDIDESNALTDHRFGVCKAWRLIGQIFSDQCVRVICRSWVVLAGFEGVALPNFYVTCAKAEIQCGATR
jgi:hypothetical protein